MQAKCFDHSVLSTTAITACSKCVPHVSVYSCAGAQLTISAAGSTLLRQQAHAGHQMILHEH
jgi:hypothetical protein